MSEISIIIIDDHPLFRQGVIDTLSLESDIWIVAQAANGEDGFELIREFRPMVAVVDVNLPEMNGQSARRVVSENSAYHAVNRFDDIEQDARQRIMAVCQRYSKSGEEYPLDSIEFVIGDQVYDKRPER
jgi:DNA-binding NarL/FixJ family response regulator